MIPEAKIAEIRERSDIVEVIGEYVTLKRAGVNHKGVCPFHADSDPSFNVNPARQFYHCFGCGVSGDIFKFLMTIEGLSFVESARRLAGRYGVELPKQEMTPAARTEQERAREALRRRRLILETAATFFEDNLWSPTGAQARELIKARGIDDEIARLYRLGYAPDSWQALLDHLREKRISATEVEAVGLALPRKGGSGYYDRFRNRLVFTITDPSGHPIAFSARVIGSGSGGDGRDPKYVNSPETREFVKGKILFGIHAARVDLSKTREAILVEGNFDVVSMAQAGFRNVVAPLGTAITNDHAVILRRRVDNVTVMFDGDVAGRKAAARAFPMLAKVGLAAYVAPLPEGEDPDSLFRKGGKEAIDSLLAVKKGLLDEIIRSSAAASDGSAQDAARRIGKLGPFVAAVQNHMERDVYRQLIADVFGVDSRVVFSHLRGGGGSTSGSQERGAGREETPIPGTTEERELIGLMLDLPGLCGEVEERGITTMIVTQRLQKIASDLILGYKRKEFDISEMLSGSGDDSAVTWFAARAIKPLFKEEETGREALKEIEQRMRGTFLKQGVRELDQQIRLANAANDYHKVLELQRGRTEIEKEITDAHQAFDKDPIRD